MKGSIPAVIIIVTLLGAGCSDKIKPGSVDVKRQPVSGITVTPKQGKCRIRK